VGAADSQSPAATIRAEGRGRPHLYLRDGQKIVSDYPGGFAGAAARPLALASADFDEDGMPDLAAGYTAADGTGIVTIHRGNVDVLWPYGKAIEHGEPPAFHPDARVFTLPEAPDFLGAGDHFALEVRGDSMVDAGIHENDTVVIRKQESAETGDIVVALIDGEEATLKRLRKRGASIALEAANPAYETRIFGPDRVKIQGKLVSLLRRY